MPNYDHLISQVREGKTVLILGAGASFEAQDENGRRAPSAVQLGELLSKKYLGGKYNTRPLNQIAEYAISESSLPDVQNYICTLLDTLIPTRAHELMTTFSWWGLATTNYDLLVEKAYQRTPSAAQRCVPYIQNGDRIEDASRDAKSVVLMKLHGCITRTADAHCPLILSTEQYIEYRKGRDRLFERLKDWARERTVVFVGHSLQDPDLRAILLELTTLGESRPRFYAVAPHYDEIETRFWDARRITPIKATFEQFMLELDGEVPSTFRSLAALRRPARLPVEERFKVADATPSRACEDFLTTDVEYVKSITSTETADPPGFYKGQNFGWAAIEQSLDVHRHLGDSIIADHFIIPDAEHADTMEFVLVKAHAGAGKSILLRRIAWDASRDYDCLCLYLQPHGVINAAALQELVDLCQERVYLFVDDAADRVRELQALARSIGAAGKYITVILAERINEWNVAASPIASLVTSSYELKYLSRTEVNALLELLAKHRALGTLTDATEEDKQRAFADRAGRQLLVALHEATLGKRFEDIIEDEFNNIQPHEAQRMYLSICILNRLGVRVRAGIIARLHGIRFEQFRERLFGPLEHIVHAEIDPIVRDYVYEARHPHIAELVFERILRNAEERYDAYLRCLRELNIDYSDDRKAFRLMTRGRVLLDLFPNHEMVTAIYDAAWEIGGGEEPYLLHQTAVYEINRPSGNLREASNLLARAAQLAPRDTGIKHTRAELGLRSADSARTPLERERLLREAASIANEIKNERPDEVYGYHTLVKVGMSRLREAISQSNQSAQHVEQLTKEVEKNLSDALQRFPGDSYLLDSDAQFASMLSDDERVMESLQAAFASNPRNSFLAIRLARNKVQNGDAGGARETLERALDANQNERRLHYEYARLRMEAGDASGDELQHHLHRSFTPGDSNYEAQLLYGRQLFINGEREQSRQFFKTLGSARVGPELRDRVWYPMAQLFKGRVVRVEAGYCFIERDGAGDWIHASRSNMHPEIWTQLAWGTRTVFKIGFTLRGPSAVSVELEGTSGQR